MNKKIDWHIGCSGFHYKEWKEAFYPKDLPAAKWFRYYREHFNTVESNMTFYRLPLLTTLQKWHDESNPDFSFSVKAPRLVTHYKRFENITTELSRFYDLMRRGLQEKLACIIFQFPPVHVYTPERLEHIISGTNASFNNVVEFRHISWWNEEVFKSLEKHSISFCNMSHPKFPDEIIPTSPLFYFRFHGVPKLYRSAYTQEYLDGVIKKIRAISGTRSAYLYFNNTAGMGAIENVRYIKSIL